MTRVVGNPKALSMQLLFRALALQVHVAKDNSIVGDEFARANDEKIMRSRDAQCNTEESP